MDKYIKVTAKGKAPVVLLASNKGFYQRQGAKIEMPTQAEIEAFFPEERKGKEVKSAPDTSALNTANAELAKANEALELENAEHTKTKSALETANLELTKANEALESEKVEHGKTKSALETKTAELAKANEALESAKKELETAQKEIEKLTKKQ